MTEETKEESKSFTYILIGSKLVVFTTFLYASLVMVKLGRNIEGIILLFAIALWILLINKDKGGI